MRVKNMRKTAWCFGDVIDIEFQNGRYEVTTDERGRYRTDERGQYVQRWVGRETLRCTASIEGISEKFLTVRHNETGEWYEVPSHAIRSIRPVRTYFVETGRVEGRDNDDEYSDDY